MARAAVVYQSDGRPLRIGKAVMRIEAAVTADERQWLATHLDLLVDAQALNSDSWHLLRACQNGNLVGASAWFRAADGSAMLVNPWTVPAHATLATDLYFSMASAAKRAGCRLALALTNPEDAWREESLKAAQFSRLSAFLSLSLLLQRHDRCRNTLSGVPIEYADDIRDRFHAAFVKTQRGSDDWVGMHGLRTAEEAFALFAATGVFRPNDWLLIEYEGRDIALLLMNQATGGAALEISYLGVVPEMRRRGIGTALVAEAIRRAASRDYRQVVTAVDIANQRALGVYSRFGFVENSRHQVFLKQLSK